MKADKKKMMISSLVIVLPMIFNLILWNQIPQHGGMTFNGKLWSCVILYLILLLSHWFGIAVIFRDRKNERQPKKVLNFVYWICPWITIISSCLLYIALFRLKFNLYMVLEISFGLMFTFIGNYFPKYRQNQTLGVRVKWTLQSEDNWNKTHRFSGKLWTVGGILLAVSACLPFKIGNFLFVPIIMILAFGPILYSYLYSKKEKKDGKIFTKVEKSATERKLEKRAGIFVTVVVIAVGVYLFTGNIHVQYGKEKITVKASYFTDMDLAYSKIESVEYKEKIDPGNRVWGFGSFRLLAGSFQNDEFGYYTRYSYYKCKAGVVIQTKDDKIVLSGKDEKSTKEIYEELKRRLENK